MQMETQRQIELSDYTCKRKNLSKKNYQKKKDIIYQRKAQFRRKVNN